MAYFRIELYCPEHGLERYRIKIIKKYNINPHMIRLKFRTRPRKGVSGVVIGRKVNYTELRDHLVQYFRETGLMDRVLSIRLQV